MKNNKIKYSLAIALSVCSFGLVLFTSSTALAATKDKDGINVPGSDINTGKVELTTADAQKAGLEKKAGDDIIKGTLNIIYSLAAVVAVIVIIAAGIEYVTSEGDPGKTATAKSAIIYAVVGLVIVGSAFIITGIVQNIGAP